MIVDSRGVCHRHRAGARGEQSKDLTPSSPSAPLWWFVSTYIKRWSIEETIRYVKTCYDLENLRVFNYQGLQN